MVRTLKFSAIIALFFVAMLFATLPAYADSVKDQPLEESVIMSSDMSTRAGNTAWNKTITTSTSWKTVITSSTGFNRWVGIHNWSTATDGLGILRADIRMLGKNGNVIWAEDKACPGYGSRAFWCGSDVYTIQIKVARGAGTAYAYPATGENDLR